VITIEELEAMLAANDPDLSVEIMPDGSIHSFRPNEPREQGPRRILPVSVLGDSY